MSFKTQTQTVFPKPYSDNLVDGVPIWQKENRGWTQEEAEAYKLEIERLGKERESKLAEAVKDNISGSGIMPYYNENELKGEKNETE